MRLQASNLSDSAHGFIAKFHHDFGVERQEDVDTRAKLDEAHVLLNAHSLFGLNIGDHTFATTSSATARVFGMSLSFV